MCPGALNLRTRRKVLPRVRFHAHFTQRESRRRVSGGPVAHIPYVSDDEAEGLLSELYDDHRNEHGVVDNILRIHSLNPRSLRDHARLYSHLMRGRSPLSRTQREMLAVTVSAENDCFY